MLLHIHSSRCHWGWCWYCIRRSIVRGKCSEQAFVYMSHKTNLASHAWHKLDMTMRFTHAGKTNHMAARCLQTSNNATDRKVKVGRIPAEQREPDEHDTVKTHKSSEGMRWHAFFRKFPSLQTTLWRTETQTQVEGLLHNTEAGT